MKKIIIVMLLVVLVISGCKGTGREIHTIVTGDIYKGTTGLSMEFLSAPTDVFEESPFRISVDLRNDGAFDIENGYLTLGLETDFINVDEWTLRKPITSMIENNQVEFDLGGKSTLNPEGSQGIVSMSLSAKTIEKMREKHTSTILLTGCYGYKTKLSEAVCIDTDVLGMRSIEKACEVEDKTLDSQGAPVAITKVEVDMLPHEDMIRPQFLIYVENKGNGEVVKAASIKNACSGESVAYDDFNVVDIKAYLFDKPLKCTPSQIKLRKKKDEIRCILDEGISKEEGTHSETLNLELDYGYTNTISTTVDIKKLPR